MTRSITFLLTIIISLMIICPSFAQTEFTQKILAVVNGEAITKTDVDEILAPIYMQYKSTYQGKELAEKVNIARKDILEQLIEDKLILQQAKKDEAISVTEKEVDQLIEELKANFSSVDEFEQILKNQGVTLLDMRKRYKDQLLIKKAVSKEILIKISITPTEVSEYYQSNKGEFAIPEKIRLRSIFLKSSSSDQEEIAKKAADIYAQLEKGVEFVEMVEKYSEAPNVVDAGDMGYMEKGSLREEIENVVFNLEPGQITKPIKTSSGYYLFRVEDKKPASVAALETVQEKIRARLYSNEVEKKLDQWINKLKESSLIEVKINEKEKS